MGCHQEAEKENAGGEISKMPEIYNKSHLQHLQCTTMKYFVVSLTLFS